MSEENFQTNKDVILNLIERIDNLEVTLQETDRIITKYNGLREKVDEVKEEQEKVEEQLEDNKEIINAVVNERDAERGLLERLGKYSGWIIGVIMFVLYLAESGLIG